MPITYKNAGVDIHAGDALVEWIKSQTPTHPPHQDRIVSGVGGFSALFKADFKNMKSPCLVSATDGVGTKIKLATEFGGYKQVAQDLVAMCVNDLICCGAEPLFFLDYYATGRLDIDVAKEFISGVQAACLESHCALIGGETAEMPGVYDDQGFDCAGFAVGVVDQAKALGSNKVKDGDRLLGLSSSGFHSNGYSLLRKVFAKDLADWSSRLLVPTKLYVKTLLALKKNEGLHSVAHITGGGLDNLLRVLPDGVMAHLNTWPMDDMFKEVQKRAKLPWPEMLRTFNCGVGMILVVDKKSYKKINNQLEKIFNGPIYDLGWVQLGGSEKSWQLAGEFDS